MAWEVVWTHVAWEDLEGVADFIARDSQYYAATFVREIRDAARSLKKFAERGRVVPELPDKTIRELLIGNYRLIYKVTTTTVFIIAFVHGARDLKRFWTS